MVNTRPRNKKIRNNINLWSPEAAMADSNHLAMESGALIGSNDDLLIGILLWLPVKSVLLFRSVSKHWRWLLSHRRFTLLHKNASNSPGFFACNLYIPFDDENRSTPPFRDLEFDHCLRGIRIVQSCNGLLLCCSNLGDKRVRRYYVVNPTIKQIEVIPSVLGGIAVRKTIYFMGLAFHQTDCDHFKVVCFHRATGDDDEFKIQIYYSDTGKWKNSDESFPFSALYDASFNSIVCWNHAIHWAPCGVTPLYFNLETEELKPLPLPVPLASSEGDQDEVISIYFGESQGHLHLVDVAICSESQLHLNVYEMLSDHSGWFIKYRVELDELPDAYPDMIHGYVFDQLCYDFDVLDMVRGEEYDGTFLLIRIARMVIRYNVVEKSFKQISDSIWLYGPTEHLSVHRYIESLVSF